jgi:hypothetical protein
MTCVHDVLRQGLRSAACDLRPGIESAALKLLVIYTLRAVFRAAGDKVPFQIIGFAGTMPPRLAAFRARRLG